MKKGISFYWGFATPPKERAELLHKIGFDCIITTADHKRDRQNGTIKQQMELFKANKITPSSLHNRYNSEDLIHFWKNDTIGEKLEKNIILDLHTANKYSFKCVVVHLQGEPNEIGLDRIKRVLKYCEKYNIPLALENIDANASKCMDFVFNAINSQYLKFCYDSGHNNCHERNTDVLDKFGDKLICLHLHDNHGTSDEHTLNKYGTINWDKIARKLAKINPNITLDYEIMMRYNENDTQEEVAKEVYKQATELEQLIQKYAKK